MKKKCDAYGQNFLNNITSIANLSNVYTSALKHVCSQDHSILILFYSISNKNAKTHSFWN